MVFLDEPTASVDVGGRQVVRAVIRDLAARGCCVLLTTHELDEAERLADHVVIVDRGKVAAAGSPADLRSRTAGTEIRFSARSGIDTDARWPPSSACAVSEPTPSEYVVATPPAPAAIATIAGWLAERDVPLADLARQPGDASRTSSCASPGDERPSERLRAPRPASSSP